MLAKLWWQWVRFGFRLLYNEMAWTYDIVSWTVSLGRWRDWQRASLRFFDHASTARVLELAHGTGNLQIDLASSRVQSIALDLSPAMGRIARAKIVREALTPRLVRGSVTALPFASGSIPVVISTFPTEFVFRKETVIELKRILEPSGRLIIVLNASITILNPVVWLLEWLYRSTGQRGTLPESLFAEYVNADLSVKLIEEILIDSKVWLMLVDKAPFRKVDI